MIPKKKKQKHMGESIPKARVQGMFETNDSSLDQIKTDLASHDDRTREKARHTLVAMGKDAVPSLIEALKNRNTLTRWEAAKALGEIADPETAPVLVETLEDEEFDVRWLAAEGLIKMNIKGIEPLLEALEHRGDSSFLREGAHHVFHDLAKGGLRKSLAPVLAALEALEPGEGLPWADRHELGVEVPVAARQALEMLEKLKKP
jgi:HEAT repeat protein